MRQAAASWKNTTIEVWRPALPHHLGELLANLRPECQADLSRLGWANTDALLQACAQTELLSMTLDGAVAAMAGTWGDAGVWVLATNEATKKPRAFVRGSQMAAPLVLGQRQSVANMVPAWFGSCLRWLEALGCAVGEAKPHGPHGDLYHQVTLRREAD